MNWHSTYIVFMFLLKPLHPWWMSLGTLHNAQGIIKTHRTTCLQYFYTFSPSRFSYIRIETSLRALHYKEKVKAYSYVMLMIQYIKCHFRLRWGSALVKNFRGMEQYNWLQNGYFIGRGLHYNLDSFGGELQAWMKKWDGCQHGNTLC